MHEVLKSAKEKAIAYFSTHDLTPEDETLITLFMAGVKTSNIQILSKIGFQPFYWEAYKYIHSQFFKDYELYSLLIKSTNWTPNPLIYMKGSEFYYKLWTRANLQNYIVGMLEIDKTFFRYLSLSHALKSEVRFIPLFPAAKELSTPFLTTIYDIEVEAGKELQMQAALLKHLEIPLLLVREKEDIIREQKEIVLSLFAEFLDYLVTYNESLEAIRT
jgi:hypothetical protein